ncbi:MAG: TRAP transporter small permease [Kiloniellales bacterium]
MNLLRASLHRLDALVGRVSDGLARAGAFVLAAMMVMTFLDVVGRYAFNSPIVGIVEMTELCMGLIIFLGLAYTTWAGGHVAVDLVTSRLSGPWRRRLEAVANVASTLLVTLMSWQLWLIAADTVSDNLLTQVWELPIYPVAYVMAAASVLVVIPLVLHTFRSVLRLGSDRGT